MALWARVRAPRVAAAGAMMKFLEDIESLSRAHTPKPGLEVAFLVEDTVMEGIMGRFHA